MPGPRWTRRPVQILRAHPKNPENLVEHPGLFAGHTVGAVEAVLLAQVSIASEKRELAPRSWPLTETSFWG